MSTVNTSISALLNVMVLAIVGQSVCVSAVYAVTENAEFKAIIEQVGMAAACGMAAQAAQGGGGLSQVAQGAASALCGLQPTLAGFIPGQPDRPVPLEPIVMPGVANGVPGIAGLPQGGGPLLGGVLGAGNLPINPGNMPGLAGQLSGQLGGQFNFKEFAGQVVGQVVGQQIGNAVNKALGGSALGQGGIGNTIGNGFTGNYAGNIGGFGPKGYGQPAYGALGAGFGNPFGQGLNQGLGQLQTPSLGQVLGTVAAGAIQNKLNGGQQANNVANNVAGLPVLQGNAPVVYGPVYGPYSGAGLNNVVMLPQGGINPGAPLSWQPLNVAGSAVVDTRSFAEINNIGGIRLASGAPASQVGYRIAGYTDGDGALSVVQTGGNAPVAGDVTPDQGLYEQGVKDGRAGIPNPLFEGNDQYDAGYSAGANSSV